MQYYRHVNAWLFKPGDLVMHGKGSRAWYFKVISIVDATTMLISELRALRELKTKD